MIPLRDSNPSRTTPVINYTIIGLNVAVFLFQLSQGRYQEEFIYAFAVIPARLTNAGFYEEGGIGSWMTILTSMFLHGGWIHLMGNMLFLYVFGDNIEDTVGHFKYIIFYLLSGVGASLTQVLINPASGIPMVGASGAIAGVLGAYVILFPNARVTALIPIIVFYEMVEIRALFFLGFWFLMQIFSGVMSLGIGGDAGGVAWWAHIGGFATGAVLLFLFRKRRNDFVYQGE